jgi:hypothetical protein
MKAAISLHYRMLRWLVTGRCPECSVKNHGHLNSCPLDEEARALT